MKKIFGNINLTWKKLIIFAVIVAIYTAIMAIIPITNGTSFRDIAIEFEWWILFGIIIICNSKSPLDSALKCFVFFLISQPLIYLIQVPFSSMGWEIFKFYPYWFKWTVLCLPMGFVGYYINKKEWVSIIILIPALLLLAFLGVGYFTAVVENFPHHLLSCISCFAIIIFVVFGIFDKKIYRIVSIVPVILFIIAYSILKGGILASEFETYKNLDGFGIEFNGKVYVSYFSGTAIGNVEVVSSTDEMHTIKVNGRSNGHYEFGITDDNEIEYIFKYYFDKEQNTVVLEKVE